MGDVYRARDTLLGREVALKLIQQRMHDEPTARARFLRECRSAGALNHPGIATLYEAGEADDGRLFFASELVLGETLEAILSRGRLDFDRVAGLGTQLAEAVAAAHAHGIVHRDLKPANLMVTPEGRLKILDFGLARGREPVQGDRPTGAATQTFAATRVGAILGTPAYMSPEQATGGPVDARSDVFSTGCVLYEMACGLRPFEGDSVHSILRRVLAEDPPSVEVVDPALPERLGSVIRRAMAKEPADRFATAEELASALRSVRTLDGPSDRPPLRHGVRPFGTAFTTLAIVGLFGIAFGIVWWYGRPGLAFHSRDKLLVASVDNRTSDVAFDLALRTALESDLQRSPYASVFDQGQIAETLHLMRKDPSTSIDEALGRDICRFAGVRALVLPRILSVGEAYELQAILVDPTTGRHVDQIRVSARGREDVLLHGIDDLSSRVRERLGESIESIAKADERVAKATTSSWEALQYFSLGTSRIAESRYQEAANLFRQALSKDSEFVGARGALGLVLLQHLGLEEDGRNLLREAWAARGSLPDWERLMLEAVHTHFVERNLAGALDQYKMIAALYPNRMEPLNNLGQILRFLGRFEEAVAAFEGSVALNQNAQVPLQGLFWIHITVLHRPAEAERYARRLVELGPAIAQFQHYLAWSLWAQDRLEESLVATRRVVALEPRHPYGRGNLPHLLLAAGKPAEAEPLYRALLDDPERGPGQRGVGSATNLAIALQALGRDAEAKEVVEPDLSRLRAVATPALQQLCDLALVAAAAGDAAMAEDAIRRAREAPEVTAVQWFDLARASSMLGRDAEAVALLARAFEAGYWDRYFAVIYPGFGELRDDPQFRALIGIEGTASEKPAGFR